MFVNCYNEKSVANFNSSATAKLLSLPHCLMNQLMQTLPLLTPDVTKSTTEIKNVCFNLQFILKSTTRETYRAGLFYYDLLLISFFKM